MKKFFSVLMLVVLFSTLSYSQSYQKGVHNINAGIGFGLAGIYGDMDYPPISLGFQYGFHEKFSLGGIVAFTGSSEDFGWGEYSYSYIVIGARGEYHFVEVTNDFDLYAGATLGYNIVSSEWKARENLPIWWVSDASESYMVFGFHGGIRYPLSPSIGLFAEVGYGIGYITAGVNFKL